MLSVTSLSFAFAHRPLFSELSLSVPRGRALHLQGGNGVGKSTLLSILAGLRRENSGFITFKHLSQPCASMHASMHREATSLAGFCEYLPAEANGLYLKMDALTNLRFWCRLRGLKVSETALHKVLAGWGLGHPLLRQGLAVGHFSTGMRRRLGLARVALGQAPCWLLDEPVNGLDAKGMALFRSALEVHLANNGLAIVISHDASPLEGLPVDTFLLQPSPNKAASKLEIQ